MKADMTQVPRIFSSTSCALLWMQWSTLEIRGIGVRPDTGYGLVSMAKQIYSESVKKYNHNK